MEDFATRYALVPLDEYKELKRRDNTTDKPHKPPYNPLTNPLVRGVKRQRADFQSEAFKPIDGDLDSVMDHARRLERYLEDIRKARRQEQPLAARRLPPVPRPPERTATIGESERTDWPIGAARERQRERGLRTTLPAPPRFRSPSPFSPPLLRSRIPIKTSALDPPIPVVGRSRNKKKKKKTQEAAARHQKWATYEDD